MHRAIAIALSVGLASTAAACGSGDNQTNLKTLTPPSDDPPDPGEAEPVRNPDQPAPNPYAPPPNDQQPRPNDQQPPTTEPRPTDPGGGLDELNARCADVCERLDTACGADCTKLCRAFRGITADCVAPAVALIACLAPQLACVDGKVRAPNADCVNQATQAGISDSCRRQLDL